ncbi:MAG: lamin tail domain-containing protein, partial [Phycisphaerae bacterium]|nr:lamin tail domain-containing protein [Phycisphaerae bacterium]
DRWKVYKLSMRPRFKDSTDDGLPTGGPRKLDYQFFADSPVKRFDTVVLDAVLNNAWNHSSQHATAIYIQDQCVGDFHNAMGGYSPHGFYAHVYINELYWGMYYLHERPDHSWAAEMFGGKKEEYDAIKHDTGKVINDGGGYGSGTATSNFYDMLDAADLVGPYTAATYNTLCDMLDVDNFITYILSHWYAVNWDWPSKNWYATHRHPNGKWRFHTWDAEHSLEWYNTSQSVRGLSPYSIHDRLKDNVEYKMRFADIVHKAMFNDGPLTSSGAARIVQARMDQVDRPIVGESARWGDTRVTIPHTREDLFDHFNSILTGFIPSRRTDLFNWLRSNGLYPSIDAPVFKINGAYQHGGEVSAGAQLTMDTPPSGTIYYTIDGSDPREPWTGNPVGTPYSPITLNKSTHVKARVLNVSTWSALNEAIYSVGPLVDNLRITEIMYHPRNAGALTDPNEEFIELKNIGTSTLNLNLVQFTEGIHFTFPDIELDPNECVVVVEDQSAFEAKYGTSVNTAGQYIGSLANNGERIRLQDAIGRTILDFEYKDGWYSIADGDGFSMTIIDPAYSVLYGSDEGLVAHWKFDDGSGGTAIDSAGGNNGTLGGDPTWVAGRINGALSFDGAGDYVVAAPVAALAGDTFTAQAWIRTSEFAGIWNPILTHNTGGNGYYFYVSSGRPAFYVVVGGSFVEVVSSESINADQWYHIAGTNDGSNMKLYIDGQLKDSADSTGFLGVSSNINIGREPVSPLYYNGLIDEVCIHNRPLSESEFQSIENPTGRWGLKSSWRTSVYRNGTPGWDDSDRLPNPGAVVINEVMAHSNAGPDWIELHNTTDEAINIGGWFLSDNNRDEPNLTKYRIANGTTIAKNGYLVFYQDTDFNNPGDPGCNVPFALSENGEKVYLSSRLDPNGFLTGYRQVEDFGASQTNVSFGRYYKPSTGNFNFVAMDYNTPDANNAYPRVGPVVINEIMYNPPTGNQNEEYIELHNITGALVTLYRYDKSAPWKLTDGIDYTFSAGPVVTIKAYGYLILAKDLTSFTARYGGMPPGVQVLDGYSGWLSNAGEMLQIGMPGDIDDEGTRHYIRIDRVTYSDGFHPEDCPGGVDLWPREADGLGKSLSRKEAGDYGNDVANWEAATLSPGTANP